MPLNQILQNLVSFRSPLFGHRKKNQEYSVQLYQHQDAHFYSEFDILTEVFIKRYHWLDMLTHLICIL